MATIKNYYPPPKTRAPMGRKIQASDCVQYKTYTDRLKTVFESADALETFVEAHGKDEDGQWFDSNWQKPGDKNWGWGWTVGEIIQLSRAGWQEGAEIIGPMAVTLANETVAFYNQDKTTMDVKGAVVDVAAFLEGVPECMMDFIQEDDSGRSVTLVVDDFIVCFTKAEEIFRRGIGICAAVLGLEAIGVAVTLELRSNMRNHSSDSKFDGKTINTSIVLHRPGQTLDPSRLAVWLCHPGYIRSVVYHAYGILVAHTNGSHLGEVKAQEKGEFVMPAIGGGSSAKWGDPEANKKLVKDILAACAVG